MSRSIKAVTARAVSTCVATGSHRYAHELSLPGLRFWPLTRYPHLVFYIEMDDHIDMWRVLHGERHIPARMHQPDVP